jgi:hypothetical protein
MVISSLATRYYAWSFWLYWHHPFFFQLFFYIFYQLTVRIVVFALLGFPLFIFGSCPSVYADDGYSPGKSYFGWSSAPNRDLSAHLDSTLYYSLNFAVSPTSPDSIVEAGRPASTIYFGFEKIVVYEDGKSTSVSELSPRLNFVKPLTVALAFGDHVLGRPRYTKDYLELLGFAFSLFCGGKALEAYYLQHYRK